MSKISTATVHLVRSGYEWALVAMDDSTGLFAVQSTYGTFAHVWPPQYRSEPLDVFVTTIDFGYFMSKTRGQAAREFDLGGTIATWRRWVLGARREDSLSKDEAREAWDALEEIHQECPDTAEQCGALVNDNWDVLQKALGSDWYEGFTTHYTPECLHFWKTLWPAFVTAIWCAEGLENPMAGA